MIIIAGPMLSLLMLLLLFPGYLHPLVSCFTGATLNLSPGTGVEKFSAAHLKTIRWALDIYIQRIVIIILTQVYNVLTPALSWAGFVAILVLLSNFIINKYHQIKWFFGLVVFIAVLSVITILFKAPHPLFLIGIAALLYGLNFMIPFSLRNGRFDLRMFIIIGLGSLTGIVHSLAPVALLHSAALCFRHSSTGLKKAAQWGGKISVCLFSLPVLALAVYSTKEIPLSPHVRQVLNIPGLYDIEIDRPANRLIVTKKSGGTGYVLRLDSLYPLKKFVAPSAELEDIVLDPERREIYHVDRASKAFLALDADTFKVRKSNRLNSPSFGSTKLELNKTAGRFLVSFEANDLFIVDRNTLKWTFVGSPGNVNLVADPQNDIIYINSAFHPFITGIKMKEQKQLDLVPAPEYGERMVVSKKRNELFAPDAVGGKIWVYSTPDLRLLRKIPSQFCVRALTVDDDHGLILAASVVTGYMEVIDLDTGQRLKKEYVGKYGRILKVDPATRRAFITLTEDGLYILNY